MDDKDRVAKIFLDRLDDIDFKDITLQDINLNNKNTPFNNKYEILQYILKNKLKEKINLLNKLGNKDISLQNKLILFFDYHFNFLKEYPKISDLLIESAMIDDKRRIEIVKKYMQDFKSSFSQLIKEEIKKKKIRDVNPDIIASAILHATHGVTIRIKYDENYNYAKAKKELVNFIYLGLKD